MECLKRIWGRFCRFFDFVRNLQVTLRGDAEVTVHTKSEPNLPKAKVEVIEDGLTVDVIDIALIDVVIAAIGSVFSLIGSLFAADDD
jgi:hypothetical protein